MIAGHLTLAEANVDDLIQQCHFKINDGTQLAVFDNSGQINGQFTERRSHPC